MPPLNVDHSAMPAAGVALAPVPAEAGLVSTHAGGCDRVSEACVGASACATSAEIPLAGRLSQGGLEAREVLRYAADLAADLAERHRVGAAYGVISLDAVVLAGGSARFQYPPAPGVSAAHDAVQFAALLRVMARACADREKVALGAALGALCGRYLTAKAGTGEQSFRKLLLALRVLRLRYPRRERAAADPQPAPELPAPRRRKIRILIRAVPPAEAKPCQPPAPRAFFWRKLCSPFLG